MTKEELLKKDFQLLVATSSMKTISYLRTIMENQAVIISKLENVPIEQVLVKMNEFEKDNYSKVDKMITDNIPEYLYEGRDYK